MVNDSGVYLPVCFNPNPMTFSRVAILILTLPQPSPTENKASWPRRYLSRNSTETRSDLGEIEPFGISRESFDSYRRSFVRNSSTYRISWFSFCFRR